MKQNMMQWVDSILAADVKKAMPVLSFPAIQKMGITVKDLLFSSDLQAQAMKTVADETPEAAASVSMMDLSLEAEAFGSSVRFSEDEVPTVSGSIVETEEDVAALKVPKLTDGRLGICIEAIGKAAQIITDRPVFAGVIGPFSLAGRLMDVSNAMLLCLDEPDMVHMLLEKVTGFLIDYINAFREKGADGVVVAEPLAGLLSPALEEEFSCDYMKRIVQNTQTDDFLVIYHNCGNCTLKQIDSIASNGCRVLHFGNSINMEEMLQKAPSDILVMGNIDPATQFRKGTPESIRKAATDLLERCHNYPNFVISSGCDIPPLSDWNNIKAFFDAVHDFYTARG